MLEWLKLGVAGLLGLGSQIVFWMFLILSKTVSPLEFVVAVIWLVFCALSSSTILSD